MVFELLFLRILYLRSPSPSLKHRTRVAWEWPKISYFLPWYVAESKIKNLWKIDSLITVAQCLICINFLCTNPDPNYVKDGRKRRIQSETKQQNLRKRPKIFVSSFDEFSMMRIGSRPEPKMDCSIVVAETRKNWLQFWVFANKRESVDRHEIEKNIYARFLQFKSCKIRAMHPECKIHFLWFFVKIESVFKFT